MKDILCITENGSFGHKVSGLTKNKKYTFLDKQLDIAYNSKYYIK